METMIRFFFRARGDETLEINFSAKLQIRASTHPDSDSWLNQNLRGGGSVLHMKHGL